MKTAIVLVLAGLFMFSIASSAYANCGMCGVGGKASAEPAGTTAEAKAASAANTICPVTGEKIDPANNVTYEYQGKIYNFCCPMCIDEFKKDPAKYIAKIEEQKTEATQESATAHSH